MHEHPSPIAIGHGWEILNGKCRPVGINKFAMSEHIIQIDCFGTDTCYDRDQVEYADSTDTDKKVTHFDEDEKDKKDE